MNASDPRTLLDRHAARVLGRWREHLRALPPSSALATPELLTPLMSPALARVRHELAHRPADAAKSAEPSPCRCGLNPLVAFYLTGETATFDVLWAQPEAFAQLTSEQRETVCRALSDAWHRVAADEVELFCGVCQRGAHIAAEDAAMASAAAAAATASSAVAATAKSTALPPAELVPVAQVKDAGSIESDSAAPAAVHAPLHCH